MRRSTIFCAIVFVMILFSTKIFINPSLGSNLVFVKNFSYWSVYYDLKYDGQKIYYAISEPVETRVYDGLRKDAYIAVTYIGPAMYSVSIYPGFVIDARKAFVLNTINSSYTLPILWQASAYTYDSADDVKILNDLISNSKIPIEVRSYDINAGLAVDYYIPLGLKEALSYMQMRIK